MTYLHPLATDKLYGLMGTDSSNSQRNETETKKPKENMAIILVETTYRKELRTVNYSSIVAKHSRYKSPC